MSTIKQRLDWAQKNQDDPAAQKYIERYKSGKLNHELKQAGMKPVEVKPKIDVSKVDMKQVMSSVPQQQGLQSTVPEQPQQKGFMGLDVDLNKEGWKERMGDVAETAKAVGGQFKDAGEDIVDTALRDDRSLAEKATMIGGRAFAGGAGAFGEFVTGLGKMALTQEAEDQIKGIAQKAAEGVAETEIAQDAINWYNNLDPRTRDQVDAAGGFASVLAEMVGLRGAGRVTKTVGEGIDAASPVVREGVGRTAEFVGDATETTAGYVGRQGDRLFRKTKEQAEQEIEESVKRIVQARTPEEIAAAKEGIKEIAVDADNIKTYEDTKNAIRGNIEANVDAIDAELAKHTEQFTPAQLGKYEKVGDKTVTTSPVQDALDGLEGAYTKSGEAARAEAIRQLREKLDTEGLTVLELNNLAREYGIEFKDRAFDTMGNIKSGYNAENFENVRSGIKDVVRERMPDDYTKELDKKLANLYRTDDLIKDIRDKVFRRVNKMPRSTFGSAVAKGMVGLADIADMLTFRITSNIMQQLVRKSRVAQKQFLNPMELEAELNKELKKIQKLMQIEDTSTFEKRFQNYLNHMQIGLSLKPIHKDDLDFFEKVANPKYQMTDRDVQIAKETLQTYGMEAPGSKANLKKYLGELSETQRQIQMDEKMDMSQKQGGLLSEDKSSNQ